jgi:hypothetical protein
VLIRQLPVRRVDDWPDSSRAPGREGAPLRAESVWRVRWPWQSGWSPCFVSQAAAAQLSDGFMTHPCPLPKLLPWAPSILLPSFHPPSSQPSISIPLHEQLTISTKHTPLPLYKLEDRHWQHCGQPFTPATPKPSTNLPHVITFLALDLLKHNLPL